MGHQILSTGPLVRRCILIGLVGAVPLVFGRFTESPFNTPKLVLLMLGVSLVAAIRAMEFTQGAPARGLRRVLLPAAAFAVPLVAAWIASPYQWWSLFGNHGRFQGLIPYLVVILFGILLADAFHGRARDLGWTLLITGAVVGGYVFVQVAGLDPFRWVAHGNFTLAGVGTLGNPNFAGGFLAMSLPIAFVLWTVEPARRNLIWKLAVLAAGGWVLTFSQGGWAAGLAGVSVAAGLIFAPRWKRSPLAGVVAATLVTLVTIGVVVLGIFDPGSRFVPSTVQVRGGWWVSAARMGADHPMLGRGPNSFAVEGVRYRTVKDAIDQNFESADDPHSVPLSLFAAAGVPGLAGFALILVWAVAVVRKERDRDPLMAAFLGAVVAYFVQSLVSIDEVALRVGLWTGVAGIAACVGVASKTLSRKKNEKKKQRAGPKVRSSPGGSLRLPVAVAGIALVGLAGAWWIGGFLLADARVHQGTVLFRQGKVDEARAHFERALGFRDEYLYRRIYGFRLLEAVGNSDAPDERLLPVAMDAFSYLDHFPDARALAGTARLWRDLAALDLDIDTGGIDLYGEALRLYTRALVFDPLNPALLSEAAALLADRKRYGEAAGLLRAAPAPILTEAPGLWGSIALYEAQAGNEDEARAALERAFSLDPADQNALSAQQILEDQSS